MVAPLENTGVRECCLYHPAGVAICASGIIAEDVGAAFGRGLARSPGRRRHIDADQMIDQLAHGPLGARGRRGPLVVSDPGDQLFDGAQRPVRSSTYGVDEVIRGSSPG
ncbi:MAG TPA: hypothetical protein VE645_01035 [Pseudonocardiaceae bacterium]|nr:hypothetical protein [Pseudonocardiaceae bacterium]